MAGKGHIMGDHVIQELRVELAKLPPREIVERVARLEQRVEVLKDR